MIPFDRIYSWLFKSFNISGETELVDRLIKEGYQELMIIKRSWIFALYMLWIPLLILALSGVSIWIALDSIDIVSIQYTLIIGNILMSVILIWSSITYIIYFRSIHHEAQPVTDTIGLKKELALGDSYFRSFFNWSITNQWILICIVITELLLMFLYGKQVGEHFWILATDTLVIIMEISLLKHFRKKMMDLEMDYNIIAPGKIFFVNQSGLLSAIQTIEGDKIKAVESVFPSKIASFFNYGTISILTEGDSGAMMGTMSMYYVTNPDNVVTSIQRLVDETKYAPAELIPPTPVAPSAVTPTPTATPRPPTPEKPIISGRHSLDTRERIRDVLR